VGTIKYDRDVSSVETENWPGDEKQDGISRNQFIFLILRALAMMVSGMVQDIPRLRGF
jgi:hypothetical protein